MSGMTMIKRKFSIGNTRQTSYSVSPTEKSKTKPRRLSLSKHLFGSSGSDKKMTRSLSTNGLQNIGVQIVPCDNNSSSRSRCHCKKGKCKHVKTPKNIQRFSPRRSSVPVSYRLRVVSLKNSNEPVKMRRHSVNNILSSKKSKDKTKSRKSSTGSAFSDFFRFRSFSSKRGSESGISSASSNDSISSKEGLRMKRLSSGSRENRDHSFSDSVLTPTSISSNDEEFKIFGEDSIPQNYEDDDVFKDKKEDTPRRRSMDFNVLLKSFSRSKSGYRLRSSTQGDILRPHHRRNTFQVVEEVENKRHSVTGHHQISSNIRDRRSSLGSEKPSDALRRLLQKPKNLQGFRVFLENEYSEENLDFWLECEHYKNQKPHKQAKLAQKIFNTYIKHNSPKEVNLDGCAKSQTRSKMCNPDKTTFLAAQQQIFKLMLNDSYRRFTSELDGWNP